MAVGSQREKKNGSISQQCPLEWAMYMDFLVYSVLAGIQISNTGIGLKYSHLALPVSALSSAVSASCLHPQWWVHRLVEIILWPLLYLNISVMWIRIGCKFVMRIRILNTHRPFVRIQMQIRILWEKVAWKEKKIIKIYLGNCFFKSFLWFYCIIYTVLQCDLPPLSPHCGAAQRQGHYP